MKREELELKRAKEFADKMREFLLAKGATEGTDIQYPYTIETVHGKLFIDPNRHLTAFMRFEEPERPPKDFGHNVHTGKWNLHFLNNNKQDIKEALETMYFQINVLVPEFVIVTKE